MVDSVPGGCSFRHGSIRGHNLPVHCLKPPALPVVLIGKDRPAFHPAAAHRPTLPRPRTLLQEPCIPFMLRHRTESTLPLCTLRGTQHRQPEHPTKNRPPDCSFHRNHSCKLAVRTTAGKFRLECGGRYTPAGSGRILDGSRPNPVTTMRSAKHSMRAAALESFSTMPRKVRKWIPSLLT